MSQSVTDYRKEVPGDATDMYDFLITQNCRPSIAAASSAYLYGVLTGQKVSQPILAEHFETTVTSISKWYTTLLENQEEWQISRPYEESELLSELPSKRTREKPPTKDELVERVRDEAGLEKPRWGGSNLSYEDIEQLTGETNPLKQKQALENQYGLKFGTGEDGTVQLNINKSGVEKVLDAVSGEST